jgi:membrane-associated phospholipid phosphatase
VVYWIINQWLPLRPRPESISSIPALISHIPDNSFPSGHALFWWASWWALHTLLGIKRITWFFFILGGLTVIARILAGIHYPWDIIIGFLLGWSMMSLFVKIPHNDIYRKWGHEFPIKIASFFRL